MARYLKTCLSALAGIVRECADRFGSWIKDRLVEAAQFLRHILQELREFGQRMLADLIRRWRGSTGC